jgi:hypothetical protein
LDFLELSFLAIAFGETEIETALAGKKQSREAMANTVLSLPSIWHARGACSSFIPADSGTTKFDDDGTRQLEVAQAATPPESSFFLFLRGFLVLSNTSLSLSDLTSEPSFLVSASFLVARGNVRLSSATICSSSAMLSRGSRELLPAKAVLVFVFVFVFGVFYIS